jgi:2-desacetyl-2-hydroxyethyl bacteriochlorophyllide A dehydrogenase
MKAKLVVFNESYKVDFEEKQLPDKLKPGELLLETQYTLISAGTELAMYTGTHVGFSDPKNTWVKYPYYPGYCTVAKVLKTGKDVTSFKQGDTVFTNEPRHRSHSIIDSKIAINIEGIPEKRALFITMGSISLTVLRVIDTVKEDNVAVMGMGIVGNLAGQICKTDKAKTVIGIDLIEKRLDAAKKSGIDHVLNPKKADLAKEIEKITSGKELNTVIEATGNPVVIRDALTITGKKGRVLLLGSPRGKTEIDFYNLVHAKGVHIIGAHSSYSVNEKWSHMQNKELVADYIKREVLKVDRLVTHEIKPEGMKEAYEGLLNKKEEYLGVIIKWK